MNISNNLKLRKAYKVLASFDQISGSQYNNRDLFQALVSLCEAEDLGFQKRSKAAALGKYYGFHVGKRVEDVSQLSGLVSQLMMKSNEWYVDRGEKDIANEIMKGLLQGLSADFFDRLSSSSLQFLMGYVATSSGPAKRTLLKEMLDACVNNPEHAQRFTLLLDTSTMQDYARQGELPTVIKLIANKKASHIPEIIEGIFEANYFGEYGFVVGAEGPTRLTGYYVDNIAIEESLSGDYPFTLSEKGSQRRGELVAVIVEDSAGGKKVFDSIEALEAHLVAHPDINSSERSFESIQRIKAPLGIGN